MARRPLPDPTVMLTCLRCGVSGRACDLFYFVKSGPNAGAITQSWCKACEYARVREHEVRVRPRRKIGPRKPQDLIRRRTTITEVDGVTMRPCATCNELLPIDRFTKQKRKDGRFSYASHCKACRCAFEKARRVAGLREIPLEVQRSRSQAWRDANPEKARMGVRRRRARLRENGGMHTLTEWLETQAAWGHRCAYCDVHLPGKLQPDHVVPVSRGGSDMIENIVPACGPCNWSKGARTGREFVGVA
jgi:5-methylcytosine-specific restriction endonuclease McrA